MGFVILIVIGIILALLAGRKGYNPALWFLAGGIDHTHARIISAGQ